MSAREKSQTTLLVRRITADLEAHPEGYDLPLVETANALGLGVRGGMSGPFYRALARTTQFHITKANGPAELAARTTLQTLTRHQVGRLPPSLQAEHAEWEAASAATPTAEQRRNRARQLALSLLALGEPIDVVERQLHHWRIHPGMAHEAVRWAVLRRGAPVPEAASGPAPIPPPQPVRAVFDPADDAA